MKREELTNEQLQDIMYACKRETSENCSIHFLHDDTGKLAIIDSSGHSNAEMFCFMKVTHHNNSTVHIMGIAKNSTFRNRFWVYGYGDFEAEQFESVFTMSNFQFKEFEF